MIKFTNVTKRYDKVIALDDINFELPNTGLVIIEGENGSGKSTIMNLIGGLDKPILGTIDIDGEIISDMDETQLCAYREKNISFIFQDGNLFENMTVEDNIKIVGTSNRFNNLVSYLNLDSLLNKKTKELSGGEKAKVGIARALLKDSKIILADEPTAAIDVESKEEIFSLLKETSKNCLVIVITHDRDMIQKYGDIVLTIKDGRIVDMKKKILKESSTIGSNHKNILDIKRFTRKNLYINKRKIARNSIMLLLSFLSILIATSLSTLDLKKMESETMIKEKEDAIYFTFTKKEDEYISNIAPKKDIETFERELGRHISIIRTLSTGFEKIGLKLNLPDKFDMEDRYFGQIVRGEEFLLVDDCPNITYGTRPKEANEIIINSYIAEAITTYGIETFDKELYKPASFEELLKDRRELNIGGLPVIITGITTLNAEQFESIKDNKDNYLSDKFQSYLSYKATHIYVLEEFFELYRNSSLPVGDGIYIAIEAANSTFQNANVPSIDVRSFYDPIVLKYSYETIETLNDDEIIISEDNLNLIRIYPENAIGREIDASFNLGYNPPYTKEKRRMKIVGISPDTKSYMTHDVLKEYLVDPIDIFKVEISESNREEVERLLKTYDKDIGFHASTVYSSRYSQIEEGVLVAKILAIVLGGIFALLGILFSLNYILNSIEEHKKEVAILKALGIQNGDILKTFALEIIDITIKAYIFTIVTFLLLRPIINYVTSLILAIKVNVMPISIWFVIITILMFLIIDIGISAIAFRKIKKTTPQALFKISSI